MNIEYKLATLDHVDDMIKINLESMPENYQRIFWAETIQYDNLSFVAIHNNKVVGYILAGFYEWEIMIFSIAVKEKYRNKKIARRLLENLIDIAKKTMVETDQPEPEPVEQILLTVRSENKYAIRLYTSLGWKVFDKIPGYYSNPVDVGLEMSYILN